MRTLHRALRVTAQVVLAAGLAALLASCATLVVNDDLPRDAEKGWVVFVSDERLPLSVSRVTLGNEGAPFDNRTARATPVAVACPPGRNCEVCQKSQHTKHSRSRFPSPAVSR